MSYLVLIVGLLLLAEKAWKHLAVIRFFRRVVPPVPARPEWVSILQPILSGDPTLRESLEHNLVFRSLYPREYIWLVDADDPEGQGLCRELIDQHAECDIHLVVTPPPGEGDNPKMVKLIRGRTLARGQVVVVLDDDTRIPDGGLEQCLPFLNTPGAGIAFGLPYYVSFQNTWSGLVAYFVNSNSLLAYIPYLQLTKPFTINGMFYAIRREVLDAIGGFDGLEGVLADDFAIAQRMRRHGYELAQTPLRHAISTYVAGFGPYLKLMQRWLIFPRESLMRYLGWRDQLLLYGLNIVPALFPLGLLLVLLLHPSLAVAAYSVLYFGYSYAIFAHLNARYLYHASPPRSSWWVPLIQVVFPIQVLMALFAPQKITWRGHMIKAEPGGGLRIIRRRPEHRAMNPSPSRLEKERSTIIPRPWDSDHDGR